MKSQTQNACMSIAMDAPEIDSNLFKCNGQFIYFTMVCQKNKYLSNSSINKSQAYVFHVCKTSTK